MHLLAFAETIQLVPDGTIFIHIALILLMIWVLNRTLYKPINRVLAEREKNKGGQSSEADTMARQAAEKEAAYSRELQNARAEGYEIVEGEIKQATAVREEKLGAVKTETAAKVASEKAEIEKQVAAAKATVAAEADKLADAIAATVIKA
jgi:F-type H+-transporting ATPase subunit b